jgi:iron complex transport system substrate-binding protein
MRRWIAILAAALLLAGCLAGCGETDEKAGLGNGWKPVRRMELDYATEFSVDYYAGGYKLLTLGDGSRFLTIPAGAEKPKKLAADIVTLQQPVENIYLAATSAMCLFDAMDRLDAISLSGSRAGSWYIENARAAMERGDILFAGKYSEPDYEMILDHNCPLAIESQMIGHSSEVKDKLEELGIAVFVDQSSNEAHPLGRTEWLKAYAALLDEEETAESLFAEQRRFLEEGDMADTGKTVAFFYISSAGSVVARKSGDYICKMIDLAGGRYVFDDLGDPETKTSTVNLEMETFFATARDADYIIYNSTIGGEIETIDQLLDKSTLLGEMKAVREGNVWCTGQNMYQETTRLGEMFYSFHRIFSGEADDLDEVAYLHRLK